MTSILALALLLGALALVLVEAWRGRVRLQTAMACVIVSLGLAVAAPVLLSRDVYSYAAYGRIFTLHGANPYVVPPSAFPSDPFVRVASREWIDAPHIVACGHALAGDEWLAVTPEGLFDGSPGGIRKVTYRMKNELSIVPAEKLNEDFRHPGLLARLLKGERPQPSK